MDSEKLFSVFEKLDQVYFFSGKKSFGRMAIRKIVCGKMSGYPLTKLLVIGSESLSND